MGSESSTPPCPQLSFTHAAVVSPFTVPQQTYLSTHSGLGFNHVATGALVFDNTNSPEPRILLIQRAAGDSMPNRWEVPGGGCDDEDPSILYGVARELWEEAGLKAAHIDGPVGTVHLFVSRSGKQIGKFNFLVEAEKDADGKLDVKLDSNEHQAFLWASEAEITAKSAQGRHLEFTTKEQLAVILQAFSQLKQKNS